ncbi:hypothetical protein BLJAPNOD_05415 [Ensifer sp. M14]|nr:hypothetical protein BLJAPNOD_05415 [Ensifer sp. M14]
MRIEPVKPFSFAMKVPMVAPHSTSSEWGGLRQGMKVSQSRCGNKSEAKPFLGQTCPIEPQKDLAYDGNERKKEMDLPLQTSLRWHDHASPTPTNRAWP